MNNRIARGNLNILNGILQGVMEFTPGLNIISGENGTLKTQLLQALRSGSGEPALLGQPLRMQAISPKRNSDRRAAEQILQVFRQNNRTWESSVSERIPERSKRPWIAAGPGLCLLPPELHEKASIRND